MPPPSFGAKKKMTAEKMKKVGCCKACLKGFLNHGGLLIIVIVYAVAGAYALIAIESKAEQERIEEKAKAATVLDSSRRYITQNAWYLSGQPIKENEFKRKIKGNLRLFHNLVVSSAQNQYWDGSPNEWNYDWTFSKSLLFTFTTMGAIGYGHIFPKTTQGQFFTIYYGMIGVPLLLLFLAIIGDFLAKSFKYIYSRLCCRWCRIRRKKSEIKKEKLEPKILWKEDVGLEPYMPTDHANVPIVINLCVIFVYLMLGGALFSYWEGWQMHEAVYFTFVTLSTIGFGDYVPGNSFTAGGNQAFISSMKMVVTMAFCMFGMALISMAINLMQEEMVNKSKWLAKEIGISGNDEEEARSKIKVKKHEPGTVQETLPDRDGNQTTRLLSAVDDDSGKRRKSVNFA